MNQVVTICTVLLSGASNITGKREFFFSGAHKKRLVQQRIKCVLMLHYCPVILSYAINPLVIAGEKPPAITHCPTK